MLNTFGLINDVISFVFVLNVLGYGQRLLIQTQCVIVHGGSAPSFEIMTPFDDIFYDVYSAEYDDITSKGFNQMKAFGEYLRNKNQEKLFLLSNKYSIDDNQVYISSINTKKSFQSIQVYTIYCIINI